MRANLPAPRTTRRDAAQTVRLTPRGVGLLTAGAALIPTGFILGYAESALIGVVCVLTVACAAAYAAWQPQLDVHRAVAPDRVTRGESSMVTLTVHSRSRCRAAALVAYDRCADAVVPVPLLRLRGEAGGVVRYPVPTSRRGVVPVGPLRVIRSDPLGLVSMSRTHGGTATVWVHPRTFPLSAVPAGVTRSLDGRFDRVPHGSITFASLREYVVGDELRHVHWRTSARMGQLMVREHVDTSLPRLVVLLDDRAASWESDVDGDGFEAACEAAASVVSAAAREDLPITLRLVCAPAHPARASTDRASMARMSTDRVSPARVSPARGMLDRLAEAEPRDGDALAEVTGLLRRHRPGDTLIYLTGPGGVADLGAVAALRGPYPVVVAGVLGTGGPAPSTMDGVLVLDASDGPEFAAAWDGVRSW